MSITHDQESGTKGFAWAKLLFGVAAIILAISLFIGASAWWEFATALIIAALALTLIVVGVRGLAHGRRRVLTEPDLEHPEDLRAP